MNKNLRLANVFSIYLGILALVVWKGFYEGPKVFYLLLGGVSILIFWIIRILKFKKNLILNITDYFYLLWIVVLIVASLAGVHPLTSFLGGSYRNQGVLFFITLWLIYKTVQLFNLSQKKFLHKCIALSLLIESVIVFIQYSSGNLYFGKPLGTIGESNAVAGFLAIGSYFVFQSLPNIFYAIPVIALLIAESKSGLISLLPNLLLIFKNLNINLRRIIFVLVLLFGVGLLIYSARIANLSFFEDRHVIWGLGVNKFLHKPFLGYGAESGEVVYNQAFEGMGIPLNSLIIDRSHNLLLDVGIWTGGIGLLIFCGFLYFYFKNLNGKYKKLAFFSFIIFSMFQPLSVAHWLLLFLL